MKIGRIRAISSLALIGLVGGVWGCDDIASSLGSKEVETVEVSVVLPMSFNRGLDTVEMAVLVPEDVAAEQLVHCAGKAYLGSLLDQVKEIEREIEDRKRSAAERVSSFEYHEYLTGSEREKALATYNSVLVEVDKSVRMVPPPPGLDPGLSSQYSWRWAFHRRGWRNDLFELMLDEVEGAITSGSLSIDRARRMVALIGQGLQAGGLDGIDTMTGVSREEFWRVILNWYSYDLVRSAVGRGFNIDIETNAPGLFLNTEGFIKGTINEEGVVQFTAPVSSRYLLVMMKSDDTTICRVVDSEMGLRIQLPQQVSKLAAGQIEAFIGKSSGEAVRADMLDGILKRGVTDRISALSKEMLLLEDLEQSRAEFTKQMDILYKRVRPIIASNAEFTRRVKAKDDEVSEAKGVLAKSKVRLATYEGSP